MTTIVFDGKTLCTDSIVMSGDRKAGKLEKVFKCKDGSYIAGAGSYEALYAIYQWSDGNISKEEIPDKPNVEAIKVDSDGNCMQIASSLIWYPAEIPWFGGSGEEYAHAAFLCGKSPRECVEIAMKLDSRSGGCIVEVNV